MTKYIYSEYLDKLLTGMVEVKSYQTQEKAALSFEKLVHEVIMECESLSEEPWDSGNLYETMQVLDFDDDIFGHKFHFELTPDYVCTSSKDAQEHYLLLLEQSSLDETEKELVLLDYVQKTKHNQNETLPPHFHLVEYSKNKLKDTLDRLEDTIYDRPPEDYKAYYDSLLQKYDNQVREEILALKKWRCKKCRVMNTGDYKEKTEGVKSALRELAPEMPLECMLQDGSDDTVNFGKYLICERKTWDEEHLIKVIRLTAAWQWLVKEQEALATASNNNPPKYSTLESAFKNLLHNYLNMTNDANKVIFEGIIFRRDNVIIGLMYYSFNKGVIDSKDLTAFISLIAPFMKLTKKRADNIRRTCYNELTELLSYQCELKDLERSHIIKKYSCADEKEIKKLFDKWDGLYAAIDTAAQKSELFKKLMATKTNKK